MRKALEVADFEPMAQAIMFGGSILLSTYGVQYRTGKGFKNVQAAVAKARKYGRCKIELELDLLAVYLHGIFKRAQ